MNTDPCHPRSIAFDDEISPPPASIFRGAKVNAFLLHSATTLVSPISSLVSALPTWRNSSSRMCVLVE